MSFETSLYLDVRNECYLKSFLATILSTGLTLPTARKELAYALRLTKRGVLFGAKRC